MKSLIKNVVKRIPPIKKIIDERNSFYQHLEELNEILAEQKSKNIFLESEILQQKTEKNDLESKLKELQNINSELEKKINDQNTQIDSFLNKINDLISNLEYLKTQNQFLVEEKQNLSQENLNLKKEVDSLNGLLKPINSKEFWEQRYKEGLSSGTGSYFHLAQFKAEIVNNFVDNEKIEKIIEFGCGDGNQLSLMNYKIYVGVDVSKTIIEQNKILFGTDNTKKFYTTDEKDVYMSEQYDLSISLDVIFHLTEDIVYEEYMRDLFNSSKKYVIIYSSNHEEFTKWPEFRHRKFMKFVQDHYFDDWKLFSFIPNKFPYQVGNEASTSASDFYIFERKKKY